MFFKPVILPGVEASTDIKEATSIERCWGGLASASSARSCRVWVSAPRKDSLEITLLDNFHKALNHHAQIDMTGSDFMR